MRAGPGEAVKRAILTDFDGTVSLTDVAEDLLAEFAPSDWWEIEELHRARKIGTRETMIRQFALVHAREDELLRFVDEHVTLDETFPDFVAYCRDRDIRLEIVSEGLDFYLRFLLEKWHLEVPARTNRTTFEEGRVRIAYPYADATCTLCGTCKLLRLFELRTQGYRVAYVGDGHSDLCPAVEADLVFAKDELADLCLVEEIPFIPFNRFADIRREVEAWP